jgi:hypothetical protein
VAAGTLVLRLGETVVGRVGEVGHRGSSWDPVVVG